MLLGMFLTAIPHQGQDTARYANRVAECLAGLLCSYVGLIELSVVR